MQTGYNIYMDPANEGQLADDGFTDKNSFAAEGVVLFGRAVVPGTDIEKQVKIPATTNTTFMGVSISSYTTVQDVNGDGGYLDTDTVPVLRRGRIWVPVINAVAANNPAYYMYNSINAGKFCSSNSNAQIVPTGVFRSSTTGAGLAILEINLPADNAQFMDKYYTVAQGSFTTTAGSATQTVTIAGLVAATDFAYTQLKVVGATPRSILTANVTTNTLTVVMSGDPGNDHAISYEIRRAK